MIVITGGGSGIGRALAIALAARDEAVTILGRRADKLDETQSHFPELINTLVADITRQSDLDELMLTLGATTQLKALVHNAGRVDPITPISDLSIEAYQQSNQLNVEAPIVLTNLLRDKLTGGRVLHISSGVAHMPIASWGVYCMTKATLFMLYQMQKTENKDIHFGSVMPGITDTSMQEMIRHAETMSEGDKAFFMRLHQEGKLLAPTVVADFLAYILCDTSDETFSEKEWDIYETYHHSKWLKDGEVPSIS